MRALPFGGFCPTIITRRDDALDHLQQGNVAEDLELGHAQHLARLLLALGNALDTAPVDLGEVAGVVNDKGHAHGQHPA